MKEEPESPSTLGNTRIKDDPFEDILQKSVKEKPEISTTCENEKRQLPEQENVKKEPENLDDCQVSTKEDDGDNTSHESSISTNRVTEKRDHDQFPVHTDQFDKEPWRQHTGPAKKRSKGADDKQPTIFSYFGKS